MPYQLIILTKDWFSSELHPGKFRVLLEIINKGYSKPMAEYGNIKSPRIKNHEKFLQSLQLELDPVSESPENQKKIAVLLLLGSESDFNLLQTKSGYARKFNPEIWPLSGSNDSDIPIQHSSVFGPLTRGNVEHLILSPSDQIDDDIADRVLATIGLKTYLDDGYLTSKDLLPETKHFEITAFTSFMRGMGKGIIEYIELVFFRHKGANLFKNTDTNKVVLHAVVIFEHELVPFYRNACEFVSSKHPDVLIKVAGSDSPLGDGIEAQTDFSISFLRKDIEVEN